MTDGAVIVPFGLGLRGAGGGGLKFWLTPPRADCHHLWPKFIPLSPDCEKKLGR